MLAAAVAVFQGAVLTPVHAAPSPTLQLQVVSAGIPPTPVTQFKYIINVDNTGTTDAVRTPTGVCDAGDAGYPADCPWASHGIESSAPIYTQGDQDDFAGPIPALANMPAGRYLISVLADGYKLDGAHFTMPVDGPVKVELQPTSAVAFPSLPLLDDFNRGNSTTLGADWNQPASPIRVNGSNAQNNTSGVRNAYWSTEFGANQGAAFTIANTTVTGDSLILKASGGTAIAPQNYVRVRYATGPTRVIVDTTTTSGGTFVAAGPAFPVALVSGDTLTAVANTDGSVDVWKTTGATTSYLGQSPVVAAFTDVGGRIGIQLPNNARVDDFRGGTFTPGLPDATIQAAIFEDISPTNSAPDLPAEHGLAGFRANLLDYLGDIQTDVYGNPLCTIYDGGDLDLPVAGSGGNCFSYCYVVDGGLDIGIVLPEGVTNPANNTGACPTDPTGLMMRPLPAWYDHPLPSTSASEFNTPAPATAAIEGKMVVPHLGTNRYALSATAPDGQIWKQTTTLEGNHDWDAWVMEGATGLDTEFVIAGEPFPAIIFGFVKPNPATNLGGSGTIKGVVDAVKVYVPAVGGMGNAGEIWGGVTGTKIDKPINKPWLSLSNLGNGDTSIWVGQGNANGEFTIPNVPNGTYYLAWWDEPQDYIMDGQAVTVANGAITDTGVLPLQDWWTQYDGYVFNDTNRNGIMDWTDTNADGCPQQGEGELGIAGYTLTLRKRENSLMDRGTTTAGTDACGHYYFESGYPMTQWLVMEAYSDLYYTTGVTYQADNQPTPSTVLGQGVDVSVLPIIGLSGRMDWGVHAYDAAGVTSGDPLDNGDPRNGGIVGTVSYDTTRNELDPRFAAVEDWQPGVSGLTVDLYAPVECVVDAEGVPVTGPCDPTARYQLGSDGSYLLDPTRLLNTYITETWAMPGKGTNDAGDPDGICVPRDVDGNELTYPTGQQITDSHQDCLEAPMMGVQFQNGFSAVDGNYGFGDGCFGVGGFNKTTGGCADGNDPTPLPGGYDYLVHVEVPNDAAGRPQYKFTREEDINIANGDPWVAPQIPPPACTGPLHTVDVLNADTDGYPVVEYDVDPTTGELIPPAVPGSPMITVPASDPTDNATLLDIGSTPYEGQQTPLCDTKLVGLNNGRSIVPTFNVFTDVPLPGRFWGLVVDDLNFSTDPKQINFGEKSGIRFAPVGIYDYTNRLVYTTESDYSGLFDVLMPSTNRISCPTPSGVCPNLYRFVGNDPGVPGRLNPNWNPQFRTIAAEFEAFPGLIVPADLAPTQVGVTVQLPGGQPRAPITCPQEVTVPKLFSVSRPYVLNGATGTARQFTINGLGFGATRGSGNVTLNTTPTPTNLTVIGTWTDTTITVAVPVGVPAGPYQLSITNGGGFSTVNGITFHVFGNNASGYNPNLYEVGPTVATAAFRPVNSLPAAANHAIQNAIDAAASNSNPDVIVVYPGLATPTNSRNNPMGAYYENLIINRPVTLQGVGPGGFQGATWVPGTIIDGSAFGGDSPVATDWQDRIDGLTWSGNPTINEGAIVSVYARSSGGGFVFPSGNFRARIDGFDLRGGNQQGFPTNINVIGGGASGLPATVVTQGGAVFANAYAQNLQISNNVVQNNGGGYGTIRIGTPDVGDNNNDNVRIANNRIIANGGTNLAGAIGLFRGADAYEVANNEICGNFSAEYGGGISAFGLSPGGNIHHNRIWFNRSYDEGGGIMIAGELPSNPAQPSPGSGAVSIHDNLIQANLSNDDGGGVRFLMAGNAQMDVYNNMIVNNVSAHEGGGVALDDTTHVRFYNNTVMKNLTTATAITSDGSPAPAGLSTGANSAPLQATAGAGPSLFSKPVLFNNIFWDNRAGTRVANTVTGLSDADADPWDIGSTDGSTDGADKLAPTNSVMQQLFNTPLRTYTDSASNSHSDPAVVSSYNTEVAFDAWRTNTAFVGAILVTADLSPTQLGNYHIASGSPAKELGTSIGSPARDIDNDVRPGDCRVDAGADEIPGATCLPSDLAVTIANQSAITAGTQVTYRVVASNAGPNAATGATVATTLPATLSAISWTCVASGGSSCPASGSGSLSAVLVNLANGGTATFTIVATLSAAATGNLVVGATVTPPANRSDPNGLNNTASDTDAIGQALPALTVLDSFNRANANTLNNGANWSQGVSFGSAGIRVNANQAVCTGLLCLLVNTAYWNTPVAGFGATQGAGFTFVAPVTDNTSLVLKASGGSANTPQNYIRVQYQTASGGQIVVGTTTNTLVFNNQPAIPGAFVAGDTLTAFADTTTVYVFRNGVLLGTTAIPTSGANSFSVALRNGGGRIGMQLPSGARVDDFKGA